MRPEGVVLPAPAISQSLSLSHRGEQFGIEELVLESSVVDAVERSSYDLAKPFCHGVPGLMYAALLPLLAHQRLWAWAMNSGPLSLWMKAVHVFGLAAPAHPDGQTALCQLRRRVASIT